MKNISLNIDKALGTVTKEQVYAQAAKANECNATLQNGNGAGNDFLGWLHLPSSITDAELTDIENTANVLRSKCEVVVAIGIGGSYLGTKAVVEALNNSFDWLHTDRKNPVLVYAGHNIGERQTVWSDQYLQIRYDNRTGFGFPYAEKAIGRRRW